MCAQYASNKAGYVVISSISDTQRLFFDIDMLLVTLKLEIWCIIFLAETPSCCNKSFLSCASNSELAAEDTDIAVVILWWDFAPDTVYEMIPNDIIWSLT